MSNRADEDQPFATILRAERKAHGLTQEAFADEIGVSQPTVSGWEGGNAYPTPSKLLGIADLLELDVEDLLRAIAREQDPEAVPA